MTKTTQLCRRLIIWLGVALLALQSSFAAMAQDQSDSVLTHHLFLPVLNNGNGTSVTAESPDVTADAVDAAASSLKDLLVKAQQGSVRVIVGLQLPAAFQAEGALTSDVAIAAQRQAIVTTRQALLDSLAGYKAVAYTTYTSIPYVALSVDAATLQALQKSALVTTIQEDRLLNLTLDSSTLVINAPAMWAVGYDGTGQAVAILDTGVDAGHPFLGGRVVAEACFSNAGGAGGGVSLCPNGTPTQTGSGAADANTAQCLYNGAQLCAHGTHVAGIAAGRGTAFSGVARNAKIIAIQVFTRFGGGVGAFYSDINKGLDYLRTNLMSSYPIAAANLSLGDNIAYTDQATCDNNNASTKAAIDNLRSNNIATVIAAGNNGWTNAVTGPGCISSAVAVGATTDDDLVASFSNMHAMVDLLAPGVSINSSVPGGGFANWNGTSMATPHVVGAWAILKQIQPTATVAQILATLTKTGVNVADQRAGGTLTKPRIRLVPPTTASLTINDVTVNESAATAVLTVTLSAASNQAVSVNYTTANNTALAGSDYTAVNGTLTIPAGKTTGQISVPIINDTVNEPDETFFVNLSNAVNATIARTQGVTTIKDDDAATCVTPPKNMVAWYTLDEAAGGRVARDRINGYDANYVGNPQSVIGKVANGLALPTFNDYAEAANAAGLNFGTGDLSLDAWIKTTDRNTVQTIVDKRAVIGNNVVGYTFVVYYGQLLFQLGDVISGHTNYLLASSPIVADGQWHLVAVSLKRNDAQGLKLYLDGKVIATFNPLARPGDTNNSATLRIGRHQFGQTGFNGSLDEIELFNRELAGAEVQALFAAGPQGKCKTTQPLPSLTISDVAISESTATAVLTVTLSAASNQGASVNYMTANNTALAGSDYTAVNGMLTIPAGKTTGQISVPIINDTVNEPDETFFVNLSNAVNATIARTQGVTTIKDDDPVAVCAQYRTQSLGNMRFLPNNTLQVTTWYDGDLSTSQPTSVKLEYRNTATGSSGWLAMGDANDPGGALHNFMAQVDTREYNMGVCELTGKVQISGVLANGVIDGVGVGVYYKDVMGRYHLLRSQSTDFSATSDYIGTWPLGLDDTSFANRTPQITDGYGRMQARMMITGAKYLGSGQFTLQ
ncbi:MAG: Calx-beta domain-containing protein [Caldilineaceae bacterium]